MKILKNKSPKAWKMEVTCDGNGWNQMDRVPCEALLEIERGDIRVRSHTNYYGETESYYGIVCPICRCFTEINESLLSGVIDGGPVKYVDNRRVLEER